MNTYEVVYTDNRGEKLEVMILCEVVGYWGGGEVRFQNDSVDDTVAIIKNVESVFRFNREGMSDDSVLAYQLHKKVIK